MSRLSSSYICQQCGYKSPQFLGKCPECGSWNSMVESVEEVQSSKLKVKNGSGKKAEIVNLADIEQDNLVRMSTNIDEFDRVLGGGIVPGSVVLVAGDPGIGKSTLLTQLALNLGSRVQGLGENKNIEDSKLNPNGYTLNPCLYIAGEESAQQIKIRVERIRKGSSLDVLNTTDVDVIVEKVDGKKDFKLLIVDSIQTLETMDLTGVAGSVGQVRECAHRLQRLAKDNHLAIFLVGHVTKEGTVAGPKTLEHLVDVVLNLEGDPSSNFRILRSSKNRFGPTDEVGIFEMEETGMIEVKNPSEMFLQQRIEVPGSVVAATLNGFRPLLVEIQALVTKSFLPVPRRVGTGVDNNRLSVLMAVLSKRLGLPLYDKDIFVNVTGGLKVTEPAVDLGICLAVVSSLKDLPVKPKTAVTGEVGLLGELRPVRQAKKRSQEAKKLGYTTFVSPDSAKSLEEAVKQALVEVKK